MEKERMNDKTEKMAVQMFFDNFSFRNIILKIKFYCEHNTALVIGFVTLALSFASIYLNLCYYAFNVGFYSYYGVALSYISIGNQIDSLMNVLLIVGFTLLFIVFNIISYFQYCKCRILSNIIASLILLCLVIAFSLVIDGISISSIKNILLISLFAFVIWFFLNAFGLMFAYCMSKTAPIYRYQTKIKILEGKCKHCNLKKIQRLEHKKNKLMKNYISSKNKKDLFDIMSYVIVGIAIIIAMFFSGISLAISNNNIGIIQNQIDKEYIDSTNEERYTFNDYSVLYQNSDFMIVSPCVTKNGKIYIFNSYQMKLDKKSFMIQNKYFDKVIFDKDDINLEEGEK